MKRNIALAKRTMWMLFLAWSACMGQTLGQWMPDGEVWKANTLYTFVSNDLVIVPPGATLTIEPGTEVQFSGLSQLIVLDGGTCLANGVKFTHCDSRSAEYVISGNIIANDETEWPTNAQRTEVDVELVISKETGRFGDMDVSRYPSSVQGTTVSFWDASSSTWSPGGVKGKKGWGAATTNRIVSAGEFFLKANPINGIRGGYLGGHGGEAAVIKTPLSLAPPVLQVDRASPPEGSLTLTWEDKGAREGVTYSVWRGAGEERRGTTCVTNGLTENTWTDKNYWAAEPVLEPLNYWVVANDGGTRERESNCVETRHRMGLCVGFDAYGTKSTPLRQSLADANLCKAQAAGAKFSMKPVLKNSAASVDGIHNALAELAEEAKPGDMVLFYIATHGGLSPSKNRTVLAAYNGHYTVSQLATDVAAFHSGVWFIGIIMACHSRALTDGSVLSPGDDLNWFLENGLAECKANVAWVTSCGMDESSSNLEGSNLTMFGEWFLNQGWKNGYADRKLSGVGYGGGNGDGTNTVLELARYAEAFARGASDDKPSHVFYENEALLGKIIMATEVASGGANVPTAPTTMTASQVEFDSKIYVSWASSSGALWYWLEGKMDNSTNAWKCLSYGTQGTDFQHTESLVGQNYQYRVRAVNGAGASGFSPIATGSRGTIPFLDWLRGKGEQIGLSGTPAELATMPSANGLSLEGCYVSGIDPLDTNVAFKAKLAQEDGKWKAKPEEGEKEGRMYRVWGKKEMDDEGWTDVTEVEDLEAEGWRFFRVGVEMAE